MTTISGIAGFVRFILEVVHRLPDIISKLPLHLCSPTAMDVGFTLQAERRGGALYLECQRLLDDVGVNLKPGSRVNSILREYSQWLNSLGDDFVMNAWLALNVVMDSRVRARQRGPFSGIQKLLPGMTDAELSSAMKVVPTRYRRMWGKALAEVRTAIGER